MLPPMSPSMTSMVQHQMTQFSNKILSFSMKKVQGLGKNTQVMDSTHPSGDKNSFTQEFSPLYHFILFSLTYIFSLAFTNLSIGASCSYKELGF
jgi:hypothetical protein